MFTGDRWAAAFAGACGDDAGEGLAALRAFAPHVKKIPGMVSGSSAAAQLDRIVRAALAKAGDGSRGVEMAARFLVLLTRRNCLGHIDSVIAGIESVLDRKRGIAAVTVESAFPLEADYLESLKSAARRRIGAADVRLIVRVKPELLGGCKLLINGECFDATLDHQLKQMVQDLRISGGSPSVGGIEW
jgi:F0F1-type ATP synthase delta subunit